MVDINNCKEYIYILSFGTNEVLEIGITEEDSNLTTEELLDKYDLDIDNCLVMYNSYRLKLKTLNTDE
nr:MAG TPA: hypothetical protein [Crassvirales sp.]